MNEQSNTMPPELAQKVPHDVRLYVRNFWTHPEDPERQYDFYDGSGEDYFTYLVHENGPLNPEQWGDIVVLLFARGCLKTTVCTMIANWAADCYPNSEGLVTAPRRDQTYEVMGRIQEAAEMSGLDQRYERDKLSHQKFHNTYTDVNGNERTAYSEIKSRSAWNEGDAIRGVHAHYGVVDEFQDVDEGMFSVFLEAIDRELPRVDYFPTIFVIGTPKRAGSFFHRLWEMSDKKEWDADEKEWLAADEPDEYLPQEVTEERERLQREIEEMEEAGMPDDEIAPLRQAVDDMEGFQVTGWHIDQHGCPRHSPAQIAFKRANFSERKFKNEVLAEFYTPENDLLTKEDVRSVFVDDVGFQSRPDDPDNTTVIGVDWGGGDGEGAASTVVAIGEVMPDDTIWVRNVDVLSSDLSDSEEIEVVEQYIIEYQADVVVVDEGYGDTNRSNLQKGVGTRNPEGYDNVYGCMYGNVNNKDGLTWSRKGKKEFFTVHRTFMIEEMVADLRRGNIKIPAKDLEFDSRRSNGAMLLNQLSAPYTDRIETRDGKKKLRVVSDEQDDIFHSFVYMWIAARHVTSRRTVRSVAAHSQY